MSGPSPIEPHVADDLAVTIEEGSAVWVSLRGKPVQGVVLKVHDQEPEFSTLPILGLTDPPVVLSSTQLRTARWIARETASGLMDTLSLFLPPGTTQQTRAYLSIADNNLDTTAFTTAQRKLLHYLRERGETSIDAARTAMGSSLASVVPALEKAGAIRIRYRIDP
jgi:primosomal protein N'